jgi:hypothetical protein
MSVLLRLNECVDRFGIFAHVDGVESNTTLLVGLNELQQFRDLLATGRCPGVGALRNSGFNNTRYSVPGTMLV